MSKVLIISAVFPPEPVVSAQISECLASELSKNHKVTVLSPQPTRPYGHHFDELTNKTDYQVKRLNSYTCPKFNVIGRFCESISFGVHCKQYIKKNHKDIDIIYLNSWPLFSQYVIIREAKKYQIKTITHIQDIYPESLLEKLPLGKFLNTFLLPLDRYILRNSTKVLAISEQMKDYLSQSRQIDISKFVVVYNWQDEDSFIRYRNSKKNQEDINRPFVFMYLGNNGPLAGVDLLIKSFALANIPNSKLIIAGKGSMTNDSIELARLLGAKNIEFMAVPNGAVPEIQDMADVMLLPVKRNGARSSVPSKLPAYMFSAKPIIGSVDLDSDTAKAIQSANCGIIVNPEDKNMLSKAMVDISQWNKKELMERGEFGFHFAMQNYSKESNLTNLITLIENQLYEN